MAGLSEAGISAGSKAPSDTELYWARADGAFRRVLGFFENPSRDLTSLDYDFLSVLAKAYGDISAFHNIWAKKCENEAFYNGFLMNIAELFAEAYRILAGSQTERIWVYMKLLEDLDNAFEGVQEACMKLHPKFQEL